MTWFFPSTQCTMKSYLTNFSLILISLSWIILPVVCGPCVSQILGVLVGRRHISWLPIVLLDILARSLRSLGSNGEWLIPNIVSLWIRWTCPLGVSISMQCFSSVVVVGCLASVLGLVRTFRFALPDQWMISSSCYHCSVQVLDPLAVYLVSSGLIPSSVIRCPAKCIRFPVCSFLSEIIMHYLHL